MFAWAVPSAVAVLAQSIVAVAAGAVSLVADCFGDCFALVPPRQRQRWDFRCIGHCKCSFPFRKLCTCLEVFLAASGDRDNLLAQTQATFGRSYDERQKGNHHIACVSPNFLPHILGTRGTARRYWIIRLTVQPVPLVGMKDAMPARILFSPLQLGSGSAHPLQLQTRILFSPLQLEVR